MARAFRLFLALTPGSSFLGLLVWQWFRRIRPRRRFYVITKIVSCLLLTAILGPGQTPPPPATIKPHAGGGFTATAGTLACTMTYPGVGNVVVTCAWNGVQYATINWQLNPGSDRAGYEVVDGNTINFWSSNVNGTVTWNLAAQLNGGPVVRGSGVLLVPTPPTPPVAGCAGPLPWTLGTLIPSTDDNGLPITICAMQGDGLTVLNLAEVAANCCNPV